MKTSTRNGHDDLESAKPAAQSGAIQGKAKTAFRCRLCRETVVLESNFRPTPAICPHCGLKFVFDPQEEPLPVRGLRLRYSEVLEAQRCPGSIRHKRHEAHVQPIIQDVQAKPNYLAWAGGLALSLAAVSAFFSGWFQKLLTR
jgi:DNA-directed RNA polymerase subunit RPC12/RpoP